VIILISNEKTTLFSNIKGRFFIGCVNNFFQVSLEKKENQQILYFEHLNFFYLIYGDFSKKTKECFQNEIVLDSRKGRTPVLEGGYLMIIFDKVKNETKIIRDPIGLQQIYYSKRGNELYISTTINELITFGLQKKLQLDNYGLRLYLTFQYIPSPYTIFKNINKIPPGYLIKTSGNEITLTKYFSFSKTEINLKKNQIEKNVKDLLIESIKKR